MFLARLLGIPAWQRKRARMFITAISLPLLPAHTQEYSMATVRGSSKFRRRQTGRSLIVSLRSSTTMYLTLHRRFTIFLLLQKIKRHHGLTSPAFSVQDMISLAITMERVELEPRSSKPPRCRADVELRGVQI